MAQVSAAAHMVLVEHLFCAEHGEQIHADEAHGSRHAGAAAAEDVRGALIRATAADEDHEHDHCLLVGSRRKVATLPANSVDIRALESSSSVFSPSGSADQPKPSVVSFAPKTSPPA